MLISKLYTNRSSSGGAKRDRTADLLRARQALSQLSYSPIQSLTDTLITHQPDESANYFLIKAESCEVCFVQTRHGDNEEEEGIGRPEWT